MKENSTLIHAHILIVIFVFMFFVCLLSHSVALFLSLLFTLAHSSFSIAIWISFERVRKKIVWMSCDVDLYCYKKKCSCSILIIVANQHGPIVILWNEQLWFSHLSSHLEKCHLSINTLSQHEQCSLFLYQIYFVYGPNI